jgi:tripartite-type tricarboxylate transporter receptor subunit TctC
MLWLLRLATASLTVCLAAVPAVRGPSAQEAFPSRPVNLVVPAAPGGLTDIIGRAVAPALSRALGQSVVVINRVGAGGSVGAGAVARGVADGYSVLVGITSLATLPAQEILNGRPPVFQVEELTALGSVSTEPLMLVTRPDTRFRALADVLEEARRKPETIAYSTTGVYGTYHVAFELVAHAANVKLLAAHYHGGGDALRALLSREVDLSLITRSVGLKQIQSGQLRALSAWGRERWPQLPDVPSLGDARIDAGYDLITGLFVARETPPRVQEILRRALRLAVEDEQFRATMEKLSAPVTYLDGPEFTKVWSAEAVRLGKVVQRIGRIQ